MGERRKYDRRRSTHYSAVYDESGRELLGRLANVSTEGLMLISDRPLDTGRTYRCRVILPEDLGAGPGVSFEASCLWSHSGTAAGTYASGLCFSKIKLAEIETLERLTQHPAFEH
jgi:hypothetical protein